MSIHGNNPSLSSQHPQKRRSTSPPKFKLFGTMMQEGRIINERNNIINPTETNPQAPPHSNIIQLIAFEVNPTEDMRHQNKNKKSSRIAKGYTTLVDWCTDAKIHQSTIANASNNSKGYLYLSQLILLYSVYCIKNLPVYRPVNLTQTPLKDTPFDQDFYKKICEMADILRNSGVYIIKIDTDTIKKNIEKKLSLWEYIPKSYQKKIPE